MEARKLELKDIAGYLPYELKYINRNTKNLDYGKIYSYSTINSEWLITKQAFYPPVLHPLSDLYKTITHNSKEIVPIVELAKIFIEGLDWKLGKTINDYSYCAKYEDWYFDFNGRFMYYNEESSYEISNDWKLYDYLHELKIDYRGLIDAGLAVDVNTLNENPL